MPVKLEDFLSRNLEGYLFEDIETLINASPRLGSEYGAVGYPLLLTVFAGIELLGNLINTSSFDRNKGADRFAEFWENYLYPHDPSRKASGRIFYKLCRHGLAHAFVVKGNLVVRKNIAPYMHLTKSSSGEISIDAVQLANDLRSTYEYKIKPFLNPGDPLFVTMSERLSEMESSYASQASDAITGLTLPPPIIKTPSPILPDITSVSGMTFTPDDTSK